MLFLDARFLSWRLISADSLTVALDAANAIALDAYADWFDQRHRLGSKISAIDVMVESCACHWIGLISADSLTVALDAANAIALDAYTDWFDQRLVPDH